MTVEPDPDSAAQGCDCGCRLQVQEKLVSVWLSFISPFGFTRGGLAAGALVNKIVPTSSVPVPLHPGDPEMVVATCRVLARAAVYERAGFASHRCRAASVAFNSGKALVWRTPKSVGNCNGNVAGPALTEHKLGV